MLLVNNIYQQTAIVLKAVGKRSLCFCLQSKSSDLCNWNVQNKEWTISFNFKRIFWTKEWATLWPKKWLSVHYTSNKDQGIIQKFFLGSVSKKCDHDCDQALIKSNWGSGFFNNSTADLLPTLSFLGGLCNFCNFVSICSLM